ncbi:hypothetical protein C1646_691730 [Rhizophagus diaphanus]|nr:hypothetical protein C1646_691730 [Rhizophagus diaphanus] [Rhizophagus sp. MUCL 43196]
MEYVENVKNLAQEKIVETNILMNLYNNHNFMLYIIKNFLNGYLLKNFKMSIILQKVVLVRFIQQNGLKEILHIGILKIKVGIDTSVKNMH